MDAERWIRPADRIVSTFVADAGMSHFWNGLEDRFGRLSGGMTGSCRREALSMPRHVGWMRPERRSFRKVDAITRLSEEPPEL